MSNMKEEFQRREEIDRFCDRFEDALKKNAHPRIEEYLAQASPSLAERLFTELLHIEVEFSLEARKDINAAEYIKRFPDFERIVIAVFKEESTDRTEANRSTLGTTRARSVERESSGGRHPTVRVKKGTELPDQLGAYRLEREIGHGGMGVVYLAREEGLDREVALKVLPTNRAMRAIDVQRFQIEAKAAAQLNHENIVPVYHVGKQDAIHYYSMKLIHGSDLSAVIRKGRESVKTNTKSDSSKQAASSTDANMGMSDTLELSGSHYAASMRSRGHKSAAVVAKSVAQIGEQVAAALHHAHQHGIIHRDIKPSNLLLDQDGNAWVADFGLAHFHDAPELTRTGDLIGTLRYMSPEQASGRRGLVDHRTDIYSLGITLYELATLKRACHGDTMREVLRQLTFERPTPIRSINSRLPHDLETIICKATERNPSDRYQSSEELALDLKKFARGEVLETRRTAKWKHVRDWFYQRPLVTGLSMVATLLLLAAISSAAVLLKNNLTQSEGRRWIAEAWLGLYEDENPGKALAYGLEAREHTPGYEADQVLLAALQDLREVKRIDIGETKPGQLVWSPDGRYLLKCVNENSLKSDEGQVILFDVESGKEVGRIPKKQSVSKAAFSADGKQILTISSSTDSPTASSASAAAIWQLDRLSEPSRILGQTRLIQPSAGAFSKNGKHAVFPAAEGNQALVFSTTNWEVEYTLPQQHTAPVLKAIYSPDGEHIATWSEDGTAALWNAAGEFQRKITGFAAGKPTSVDVRFSPDSKVLFLMRTGRTNFYSVADESVAEFFPQNSVAYSSDGTQFVKINLFGAATVCDSQSFNDLLDLETHGPNEPPFDLRQVSFEWVGKTGTIAEANRDSSEIRLFDSTNGRMIAGFFGHEFGVPFISSRPQNDQFATVSWDRYLRIWNGHTNAELRNAEDVQLKGPSLQFSLDGKHALASTISAQKSLAFKLVEGSFASIDFEGEILGSVLDKRILVQNDGELTIIDPATRRLEASTKSIASTIRLLIKLEDGNRLLFITDDSKMFCWDLMADNVIDLNSEGDEFVKAALDANGKVLACTQNGELIRYDTNNWTREEVASFNTVLADIDFDSAQQRLLITADGHGVVIRNDRDGATKVAISPETLAQNELKLLRSWFTLDGNHVVTKGSRNKKGVLGLWSLETQELIQSFELKAVGEIDRSADRQRFAIPSSEGTKLWDLATGELHSITELPTHRARFLGNHIATTTTGSRPAMPRYGQEKEAVEQKKPTLLIWNLDQKEITRTHLLTVEPQELIVDLKSEQVFASGLSYGGLVLDVEDPNAPPLAFAEHGKQLVFAAFLADGDSVVTVSRDGTISLRDLTARTSKRLEGHSFTVTAAGISPDRMFLVTSDASGLTRQWDLTKQELSQEITPPAPGLWATQHAFTNDNLRVLSLLGPRAIAIRDLRSDVQNVLETESDVWRLSLGVDGKQLLAIIGKGPSAVSNEEFRMGDSVDDSSKDALLIDLDNKTQQTLQVDGDIVSGDILPEQQHAAFLTSRGVVEIVNLETQEKLGTLKSDRPFRSIIGFGVKGSETLFVQTDRGIEGWNWNTSEQVFGVRSDLPLSRPSPGNTWTVEHPNSNWRFFLGRTGLLRIPKVPARYARELAPWTIVP